MFLNAVKLFSINDLDIKVDPSWLIELPPENRTLT
jgi:hypothetical protein